MYRGARSHAWGNWEGSLGGGFAHQGAGRRWPRRSGAIVVGTALAWSALAWATPAAAAPVLAVPGLEVTYQGATLQERMPRDLVTNGAAVVAVTAAPAWTGTGMAELREIDVASGEATPPVATVEAQWGYPVGVTLTDSGQVWAGNGRLYGFELPYFTFVSGTGSPPRWGEPDWWNPSTTPTGPGIAIVGSDVFTSRPGSDEVSIYNVGEPDRPVRSLVGVGVNPWGVTRVGDKVYVANAGSPSAGSTVSVIDPATYSVERTLPVGGIATSIFRCGDMVWIPNRSLVAQFPLSSDSVSVIDIRTQTVRQGILSLPADSWAYAVACAGQYAFVSLSAVGKIRVFDVSDSDGIVTVGDIDTTTLPGTGGMPFGLAIAQDKLFVALNPGWGGAGGSVASFRIEAAHTVTFRGNGGSGVMADQRSLGAASLVANRFTRAGYTFTGWNTAADGSGTAYGEGQTYPFTSEVTLYAQWRPNPSPPVTSPVTNSPQQSAPQASVAAPAAPSPAAVAVIPSAPTLVTDIGSARVIYRQVTRNGVTSWEPVVRRGTQGNFHYVRPARTPRIPRHALISIVTSGSPGTAPSTNVPEARVQARALAAASSAQVNVRPVQGRRWRGNARIIVNW